MALQNFVDNVSLIKAAWLNNVDQAVNGTGTSLQGAGLIPYTPGGGAQPPSPAGSVGAALDGLKPLERMVVLYTSVALTANTVKNLNPAGGTAQIQGVTMNFNATNGVYSFPGGAILLFSIRFSPGYTQPANAGWHFSNVIDSANVDYSDALPAGDTGGGVKFLCFVAYNYSTGSTLTVQCSTTNTVSSLQVTVMRLA